jgi:hypothetical protein|tara:strand:- start:127 stop:396 length:270 start_codon:yes stop_codon:yes gene_type:complete
MKLTSKMLKKIILEEMEALKEAHYQDPTPTMFTGEPELDPEVPPMFSREEEEPEGFYNPINGEFVPGMTEDEVRDLIDEYEQEMALGGM